MKLFALATALVLLSGSTNAQQPANPQAPTGTNLQGKTIEGGTRQQLSKGDWVIVPSGVPHQFADIKGNLTIMSLYLPNVK